MPRENSFSDSEGRSLTSDGENSDREEDAFDMSPSSPTYGRPPVSNITSPTSPNVPWITSTATSPTRGATRRSVDLVGLGRLKTFSRRSLRSQRPGGITIPPSLLGVPSVPNTGHTNGTSDPAAAHKAPLERFRGAVLKVMAMKRGMSILGGGLPNGSRIGAEPGVDPRRPSANATYGRIHQECEIEIIDYSSVRSTHSKMGNAEFVQFMGVDEFGGVNDVDGMMSPPIGQEFEAPQRAPWVRVRWINIAGVSWDVIRAVSIRYNLHPLALEDVFHGHARNRSKVDYYSRHLFLRVLCHELGNEHNASGDNVFPFAPRTTSPEPLDGHKVSDDRTAADGDGNRSASPSSMKRRNRISLLPTHTRETTLTASTPGPAAAPSPAVSNLANLLSKEQEIQRQREDHKRQEVVLDALKKSERVAVSVQPMFIFLFRDGTVISIHPTPNLDFTAPISHRLRSRDTVLRKSADPSLLLHALLDLIVDRSIRLVEEYHHTINKHERQILLQPKTKTLRRLHILSGDLIMHKRTLEPIKTLVYGLRRYDVDRCAALVDSSDPANKGVEVVGFMSHKSKIYLADVYDHMEYILTSLDMFASITENLIGYTFNMASYEMNETMRLLTLATVIFLPLTILTGYFGMNFERMWSVHANSDLFFWELAIPILIVVIPLFLWKDFRALHRYIQKRMTAKKAATDPIPGRYKVKQR